MLDEAQKQFAGLAKAAEKALRQLTEVSKKAQLFEGEVSTLISRLSKVSKARDDAGGLTKEQGRRARTLEARGGVLKPELNRLKQIESSGYNILVVSRKVAGGKGDMNCQVHRLRWRTYDSYAIIRHYVDQSLVEVSKCL